jgi:uncharacterized protein
MRRRTMLKTTGAAIAGLSAFPFGWVSAGEKKKHKVLYYTCSAGFEHDAVKRKGSELSFSERYLTAWGTENGFDVTCTKDGSVFDGDLNQYDAFAFYTSGDLTKPDPYKNPPMTLAGKQRLLDAIAGGKGFVGFHSANDSFHSKGASDEIQMELDPYIAMVGGEFVVHGQQQKATVRVTSPAFPGLKGVGESMSMNEEWYALKNFGKDLHVILVQETAGMKDNCYQRPPYPATWARIQGKGRVFYTSFGHREDVWLNPQVKGIILGGLAWVLRDANADVTPNVSVVTPNANELPKKKSG